MRGVSKLIVFISVFGAFIASAQAQKNCYSCDSESDSNCATVATALVSSSECPSEDNCIIAIVGQRTVRGCSSTVGSSCTEETCYTCSEENCNNIVYPENRLSCHKCSNCDKITSTTFLGVCENYNPDDSCYVYADTEIAEGLVNIISERGCYSTTSSNGPTVCDSLESSGKCVKCQGDGCNSKATYGSSELTCVKCNSEEDESCETGQNYGAAAPCAYNALLGDPEFCYTYTSAEGVITKGCLGDYDTSTSITIDCNADDPKCAKCTGKYCNRGYGTCIFCDGSEDNNQCSTLSGDYSTVQCDGSNGEYGCFRSEISGQIIRGCVSQLAIGEVNVCKQGQSCKICLGDNCNQKESYQTCYSCNSADDKSCSGNQNAVATSTICSDYMDTCTAYVDSSTSMTIRECRNVFETATCPGDTCVDCSANYCNGAAIPWNRIRCHQCSGAECESITTIAHSSYCQRYDPNDECYSVGVNIDFVDYIYRGCMSDIDEGINLCSIQGENCNKCSSSDCNTQALKVQSTLSCIKCTSATDPNCGQAHIGGGESCTHTIFAGQEDYCYTFRGIDGIISRGCLYEASETIVSNCAAGDEKCQTCTGSSCNFELVEDNGRCYSCIDCETVDDLEPINCPQGASGCFLLREDHLARGCKSELTASEVEVCDNISECKYCEGDLCNAKADFQRCHKCDSISDSSCLYMQTDASKVTCDDYMDQCVNLIDSGRMYRGCRMEMENVPDTCASATCQICDNGYCNSNVFPSSRLWCNRCSGAGECLENLSATDAMQEICPIYNNPDSCYSVLDENKVIHRGCLTDSDAGTEICENSGEDCLKCATRNCNQIAGITAPTLSCSKCDGNEDCSWGQDLSEATTCTKEVLMTESESCYSIHNADGYTKRGCSLDDNLTCGTDSNCDSCTVNGCNRYSYNYHHCYQCNSDRAGEESCAREVEDLESTVCHGDEQKKEDIGCYMLRQENGAVARGCLVHLDAELKETCLQEGGDCVACDSDGCNDKPGAGAIIKSFPIIVAFCVWISLKMNSY